MEPEALAASTSAGTVLMLLNAGPFHAAITRLSREALHPPFGSSANLSLSGTKFRVEDIEPEMIAIADIVIDRGLRLYRLYRASSTLLDLETFEVVRHGGCFELIADALQHRFGITLPPPPACAPRPWLGVPRCFPLARRRRRRDLRGWPGGGQQVHRASRRPSRWRSNKSTGRGDSIHFPQTPGARSALIFFPSSAGRSLRSLGLRALRRAGAVAPAGPLRGPVPLTSHTPSSAGRAAARPGPAHLPHLWAADRPSLWRPLARRLAQATGRDTLLLP